MAHGVRWVTYVCAVRVAVSKAPCQCCRTNSDRFSAVNLTPTCAPAVSVISGDTTASDAAAAADDDDDDDDMWRHRFCVRSRAYLLSVNVLFAQETWRFGVLRCSSEPTPGHLRWSTTLMTHWTHDPNDPCPVSSTFHERSILLRFHSEMPTDPFSMARRQISDPTSRSQAKYTDRSDLTNSWWRQNLHFKIRY